MQYLVDGHNLIPALGLSLRSAEDEMQLVARLQVFCRVERSRAEVYFDGAPAGQAGPRRFGLVTAHFVRQTSTADSAIRARLASLGNAARNWTVVSADREVQAAARAVRAEVVSSQDFASRMQNAREISSPATVDEILSEKEVGDWLKEFREK